MVPTGSTRLITTANNIHGALTDGSTRLASHPWCFMVKRQHPASNIHVSLPEGSTRLTTSMVTEGSNLAKKSNNIISQS
jgi:hypothetical protein